MKVLKMTIELEWYPISLDGKVCSPTFCLENEKCYNVWIDTQLNSEFSQQILQYSEGGWYHSSRIREHGTITHVSELLPGPVQ